MDDTSKTAFKTKLLNDRSPSFFSDLGPQESADLSRISSEQRYGPGQTIAPSQTGQTGFFLIQEGFVFVRRQQEGRSHGIRIVGPGDIFICGRFWSSNTYYGTALSPLISTFFEKEAFFDLQEKSPAISREIVKWMFRDVAVRDDRIATLENHSVKARIAGTLLSLYNKFGKPASDRGIDLAVPIDRKGLAELSGTIVETLARVLTDFEERRILARKGRKLLLLDVEELRKMAKS